MRSFPTTQSTILTPSRLISAIALAFLLACFAPAIIGSLQAEESSSGGVTFISFGGSPAGTGEWFLSGYIAAGDPSSVTIAFSGAAGGTATAASNGYFFAIVSGEGGTVNAKATYLSETAITSTELSSQSS